MPVKMNSPRAGLLQLAKLVAGDLRRNAVSPGLRTVGAALLASPDAAIIVLDLLLAEANRKRPKDELCNALLFMIGQALTEARMAREADAHGPAATLIEEVRRHLARAAQADRLRPEVMLALAQQFATAKLDLGEDLQALTVTLSEQSAAHGSPLDPEDVAGHYASLADSLDHDPFLIHANLSDQLAVFPDEQRSVIVGSFATSDVPAMREAALGWLLDPSAVVQRQVAEVLAATATRGLLSAASADRMVLMRPWLQEGIRASVDAAVRTCRQQAERPAARPMAQMSAVLASGCDGAGAQSGFVILKRGRKLALASLLVKHCFGVRDAWVRDDLSRREVDQILAEISAELDAFDPSPEVATAAVAHGLAVGLEQGEFPPFGLVQFLETVGLPQVRPKRTPVDALIAQLLDAVPAERRSARAVAAALTASKRWPKTYVFLQSWFEQDAAAHGAVRSATGKKARQDAILQQVVLARRARWAELLAWTAKACQDQIEDESWLDFALVARELLSERPLAQIPIAGWIAANTVSAFARS